jgi:hypothetical protein
MDGLKFVKIQATVNQRALDVYKAELPYGQLLTFWVSGKLISTSWLPPDVRPAVRKDSFNLKEATRLALSTGAYRHVIHVNNSFDKMCRETPEVKDSPVLMAACWYTKVKQKCLSVGKSVSFTPEDLLC